MDIVIKRANIDDLKIIQELNNRLFELEFNNFDSSLKLNWPYGEEGTNYFKDMIENEIVLLAVTENQVVGYLAGSLNVEASYNTRSLAEIDNMFILEEYRQYGIGRKLIDEFKKYAKENNIEELKVTASAKNVNAILFYKKNGLEEFDVTLKMKI